MDLTQEIVSPCLLVGEANRGGERVERQRRNISEKNQRAGHWGDRVIWGGPTYRSLRPHRLNEPLYGLYEGPIGEARHKGGTCLQNRERECPSCRNSKRQ